MALIFRTPPPSATPPVEPPPAEPAKPYTILDALADLVKGKQGTLMLVHHASGIAYQVKGIIEGTHVVLKGPNGMTLRPRLTEREVPLYTPMWR